MHLLGSCIILLWVLPRFRFYSRSFNCSRHCCELHPRLSYSDHCQPWLESECENTAGLENKYHHQMDRRCSNLNLNATATRSSDFVYATARTRGKHKHEERLTGRPIPYHPIVSYPILSDPAVECGQTTIDISIGPKHCQPMTIYGYLSHCRV